MAAGAFFVASTMGYACWAAFTGHGRFSAVRVGYGHDSQIYIAAAKAPVWSTKFLATPYGGPFLFPLLAKLCLRNLRAIVLVQSAIAVGAWLFLAHTIAGKLRAPAARWLVVIALLLLRAESFRPALECNDLDGVALGIAAVCRDRAVDPPRRWSRHAPRLRGVHRGAGCPRVHPRHQRLSPRRHLRDFGARRLRAARPSSARRSHRRGVRDRRSGKHCGVEPHGQVVQPAERDDLDPAARIPYGHALSRRPRHAARRQRAEAARPEHVPVSQARPPLHAEVQAVSDLGPEPRTGDLHLVLGHPSGVGLSQPFDDRDRLLAPTSPRIRAALSRRASRCLQHCRGDRQSGVPLLIEVWIGLAALAAVALRRFASRPNRRLLLAIGVVAILVVPHYLLVWHGNALEVDRHSLTAAVQLRLVLWIVTASELQLVLDRIVVHQSRASNTAPTVAPNTT